MSTPTNQMTDIEAVNGKGNDWIWHAIFGGLTAVTLIGFMIWGHDYVDGSKPILLGTAILFALFMAFNIGGNDVANSFGTSVGAGTLSMKQALVVAAIFEVSGAILAGGEVTDTVRSGIVDLDAIDGLVRLHHDVVPFGCGHLAPRCHPYGLAGVYHSLHRWRHRRRRAHRWLCHRQGRLGHGAVGRDWHHCHLVGALPCPRRSRRFHPV